MRLSTKGDGDGALELCRDRFVLAVCTGERCIGSAPFAGLGTAGDVFRFIRHDPERIGGNGVKDVLEGRPVPTM